MDAKTLNKDSLSITDSQPTVMNILYSNAMALPVSQNCLKPLVLIFQKLFIHNFHLASKSVLIRSNEYNYPCPHN